MRCVRWIARAHNFGRLQITVFRYRGEAWSCWLEGCRRARRTGLIVMSPSPKLRRLVSFATASAPRGVADFLPVLCVPGVLCGDDELQADASYAGSCGGQG
jgi:hypothetical protein